MNRVLPVALLALLSFVWARAAEPQTQALFDGKSLAGWVPSNFEPPGDVKVVPSFKGDRAAIVIEPGTPFNGITWIKGGTLPRTNYEISLEAMRVDGFDFFCALTFPIGDSAATFVMGGWSSMVVGLSSINGADASENETTAGKEFTDGKWYRVRVRVTDKKVEAWIDDEQFVDVEREGRKFSLRAGDISKSLPLGIATYMTKGAVRDITLKRL